MFFVQIGEKFVGEYTNYEIAKIACIEKLQSSSKKKAYVVTNDENEFRRFSIGKDKEGIYIIYDGVIL